MGQNKKHGSEIQSLVRREWALTRDRHHASLNSPSRIDEARSSQKYPRCRSIDVSWAPIRGLWSVCLEIRAAARDIIVD